MDTSRILGSFTFILWCGLVVQSESVELFGAGASFPSAVYTQWINAYRRNRIRHVDVNMKYDSIGSGGGKARIKGEQHPEVHYAGSDITLTDEEKMAYPDLITIPTMAGAIVVAFNIPGLENLNLSLNAIVGIYNGTIRTWNDPVIANLNPGYKLPSNEIVVVVRADKSGTTNAFTSSLSSYSREWRDTYGTFSEGRDENTRTSVKWKNDTVRLYGQTNRGISGLIMSIDYTVGYVAIDTAKLTELHYATLINGAGNLVNATVKTVQNAIKSVNGSFDIMNTLGPFAYPLASFTYFIVPISTMTDCHTAVEFVRYVNWFYSSAMAQEQAINLFMVPLDNASASGVVNKVLKVMTCGGKNVWLMMLEQIKAENEKNETKYWQIPTFICLCLFIAVSTGFVVHLCRREILLQKELLKDTWKIDDSKISLDQETIIENTIHGKQSTNSPLRDFPGTNETEVRDDYLAYQRGVIGVFNGQPVTMIKMSRQRTDFMLSERRMLIWMRDNVKHANIMQFIGVTKFKGTWSMVCNDFFLGSLSDILRSNRIKIHTEGLVALSKALVRGLSYLHQKGIVHGHLTGMNCLIDTNWNLRISAWIETKIEIPTKVDINKVSSVQDESREVISASLLWVAPEILKFKRKPTQASDIYSLSMVFQEMFTRKDPYHELKMTSTEVINAVLTCDVRPKFASETPMIFRSIMERCWDMDSANRPEADTINSIIKAAFPATISFLDCIIRSAEMYARQLEETIKGQDTELGDLNERMNECLYQNVPISVANELKSKLKIETEAKESVCIIVCKVANITSVIKYITTRGIMNLFNNFYTGMDQLVLHNDIYKLNRYATETIFILGLQRKDINNFEAKVATEAAHVSMLLNNFAMKFSRERLAGINTEIRLQTGLSSGSVTAGILGSSRPHYTAFGNVLEEASELARIAEPCEVRVSKAVYSCLIEQGKFIMETQKCVKSGLTRYSLHSQTPA